MMQGAFTFAFCSINCAELLIGDHEFTLICASCDLEISPPHQSRPTLHLRRSLLEAGPCEAPPIRLPRRGSSPVVLTNGGALLRRRGRHPSRAGENPSRGHPQNLQKRLLNLLRVPRVCVFPRLWPSAVRDS